MESASKSLSMVDGWELIIMLMTLSTRSSVSEDLMKFQRKSPSSEIFQTKKLDSSQILVESKDLSLLLRMDK